MFRRIVRYVRSREQRRHYALIEASGLFDSNYYVSRYPDVRLYRKNPLFHYLEHGGRELRSPSARFDAEAYAEDNPAVRERGENPLLDWLLATRNGEARVAPRACRKAAPGEAKQEPKKRPPLVDLSPYVDARYYSLVYGDEAGSSLGHYADSGRHGNRSPSPEFDGLFYYRRYRPELRSSSLVGAEHYALEGKKKGFLTRPPNSVTLDAVEIPRRAREPRIAVQLHLFYPEMVDVFLAYLRNIEFQYSLYISTCSDVDRDFILARLAKLPHSAERTEVRVVPNRGRDLAPLLVAFGDIWKSHDYVCHLHSKRSPHTSFGDRWLQWNLRHMFGTPELVERSVDYLEANAACGLLFCDNFPDIKPFVNWGGNERRARAFLSRLGYDRTALPEHPQFAAGSMAWFRTSAFERLVDAGLGEEDFEAERGQVEGTFPHVLERVFPTIAAAAGFHASTFYLREPPPPLEVETPYGRSDERDSVGTRWRRDEPAIANNRPQPLDPSSRAFNPAAMEIHWIIPDFVPGLGGHMTIFRIVQGLERRGHRQTIWIQNPLFDRTPREALQAVSEHFRPMGEQVALRYLPDDVRQLSGDVVIATDCWTAFPASVAANFKERFYFIQDFEPLFHPMGENYLIAEMTYKLGFSALCAGSWLLDKARDYGMWARKWDLCADREVYFPAGIQRPDPSGQAVHRIVFYCRASTPRRAVRIGIAAFEELARRRSDFVVQCFGEEPQSRDWSFPFEDCGILTPAELAALYRSSTLGVSFSTTNYSLVPLEMMACGLAVVEIDSQSARAAFPEGTVTFAGPGPLSVADAIERCLDDEDARRRQSEEALDFVGGLDWARSAAVVESAVVERLEELGFRPARPQAVAAALPRPRRASVVIPTYNGGEVFHRVLRAIGRQRCDFPYDILVIDSSSTDGTAQFAADFGGPVRLHVIPKAEFQHGRTRNLGISLTEGDFVAMTTQDALPADDRWLQNLVDAFEKDPLSGAVFGRHRGYPDHSKLVSRDLEVMFGRFEDLGPVFSLERGLPSFHRPGSPDWRMAMTFYSDNNSALRREVWKLIPYPEVEWGEDQIWASEILRAGFSKIYSHDAVVFHSHDLPPAEQVKVGISEGMLFARHFGIRLHPGKLSPSEIEAIVAREKRYCTAHGLALSEVDRYVRMLACSVEGRTIGASL